MGFALFHDNTFQSDTSFILLWWHTSSVFFVIYFEAECWNKKFSFHRIVLIKFTCFNYPFSIVVLWKKKKDILISWQLFCNTPIAQNIIPIYQKSIKNQLLIFLNPDTVNNFVLWWEVCFFLVGYNPVLLKLASYILKLKKENIMVIGKDHDERWNTITIRQDLASSISLFPVSFENYSNSQYHGNHPGMCYFGSTVGNLIASMLNRVSGSLKWLWLERLGARPWLDEYLPLEIYQSYTSLHKIRASTGVLHSGRWGADAVGMLPVLRSKLLMTKRHYLNKI